MGPYSGFKSPKRKIVKNRSYYLPSEDNDDTPYAYVDSSADEMDEPTPVIKKQGKKRASTTKKTQPLKKRRYTNKEEEEDYSDDNEDYNDDYTDDDRGEDDDGDDEEEVPVTKSKKKHRHRSDKKIKRHQSEIKKKSAETGEGKDSNDDGDDEDDSHHGQGLEFIKPKKMSVSMKLKQEEQKTQKTDDTEVEDPEVIVTKLNNLGTAMNSKQGASVLDLKNTDISLLTSTLKGVIDAQLPEIPGLEKEELKKFCKSKTTLKEKKRMLMNSQFFTPLGKYLSMLEIDN